MEAVYLETGLMKGAPSDWESSKGMAKAILYDRGMRRKWLARLLALTVGWMAVGLWVIDGWLGENAWRFVIWWAACGLLTCVLMVFALYDALAVVREERGKD